MKGFWWHLHVVSLLIFHLIGTQPCLLPTFHWITNKKRLADMLLDFSILRNLLLTLSLRERNKNRLSTRPREVICRKTGLVWRSSMNNERKDQESLMMKPLFATLRFLTSCSITSWNRCWNQTSARSFLFFNLQADGDISRKLLFNLGFTINIRERAVNPKSWLVNRLSFYVLDLYFILLEAQESVLGEDSWRIRAWRCFPINSWFA